MYLPKFGSEFSRTKCFCFCFENWIFYSHSVISFKRSVGFYVVCALGCFVMYTSSVLVGCPVMAFLFFF